MGFGQRPPPAFRRPYRERVTLSNVGKGEPATNRRPRLDYRTNPESSALYVPQVHSVQLAPNGSLPPLPDDWKYWQTSGSYTPPGSQPPQWNPVVPMYLTPVPYLNEDQYNPPHGYQYLIPVTHVQQTYQSAPLTEGSSPQHIFDTSQLVHTSPQPTIQNHVIGGYSENGHVVLESQQNVPQHETVMAGVPYPVHQPLTTTIANGSFQYGHQQHSHMMTSYSNSVGHPQSQILGQKWSAQGSDMGRLADATNTQHLKYSQIHSELHEPDMIKSLALKFVEEYCPLMNNRAYCHPPVIRSRHPDKASKQLVMGMESEQRVIGTFERFFAASQIPVFMLCHYPISGFLQQYHNRERPSKETGSAVANNRETVTLILISHKFSITAVTVSIISSNSDFSYIQRGVTKAAGHVAKCGKAVAQWLASLGLVTEVREVLAFPNLRQSMMQRITRDKALQKNISKVSLLYLDDLCAPFEEEWSTPALKLRFSDWMHKHVLCRPSSLPASDVQLFVGALLCPELSYVDNMKNVQKIDAIPDNPRYNDKEPTNAEDIGQLQLTINGVTMGFDDFMEKYVSCYYPEVDSRTYRVPPLHFNIQSFKRGTDYLKDLKKKDSSDPADKKTITNGNHDALEEEFMPNGLSYQWKAAPVAGRLSSGLRVSDEEFSDPEDVSQGWASDHWPVERVTLDSLPDDSVQQELSGTNGALGSSVVAPHSRPGPLVLLAPSSKPRNAVKEQTAHGPIQMSMNGIANSQAPFSGDPIASLGLPLSSHSKASVKAPLLSEEEAQAVIFEDTRVLSEVMAKDARADEGENRVINAMELLGQKFGPMFIICSYQYNNYLNKLREEMFSKGEATRPTRAFGQIMRAEHDCLIFHKDLGILVVCIKAIGDNFSDWNASQDQIMSSTAKILHKALKQLEREEAMIRHVTSDLKSRARLVCHRLVALPNMRREQVDAALDTDPELAQNIQELTYGRGTKSFLCLDELPEKNMSVWDPPEESILERLEDWWKNLRSSLDSPENAIDTKVYKHIIGRYCGLLSTVEVWSPTNPRIEVRSRSEAVSLCAQRFSQVVLLPEQLRVLLSEHNRIYLYGPPGSGKTLLLILKAREWLLRGHTVLLINSRWDSTDGYPYAYGVLDRLKKMMTKDGVPHERLEMYNIDTSRFHPSMLSNVLPSRSVLVDEVSPSTLPIIEHLCCLQVQNIWCAGLFLDSRPRTAHRFHAFKMEKVLRCPPIVQSLLKHTERDAKYGAPYWDVYEETSSLGASVQKLRTSQKVLPTFQTKLSRGEVGGKVDPDAEGFRKETSLAVPNERDPSATEGKEDMEVYKYDVDSLNKRLAMLSGSFPNPFTPIKKDQVLKTSHKLEDLSSLISDKSVSGLPTDGPRPHIIDHEPHNKIGLPSNCEECGKELANFLLSMVSNESSTPANIQENSSFGVGTVNDSLKNDASGIVKSNKHPLKGEALKGRTRKGSGSSGPSKRHNETKASATAISSPGQRQRSMFDNKALSWSDVLIVTSSISKSSALLNYLQKQNIPLEVVASGRLTRTIETSREKRKLFVTTYTEVLGLERALIVFVPSGTTDYILKGSPDLQFSELKNLSLRSCLQRYNEDDRRALWFMASRCLSDLVLLLP